MKDPNGLTFLDKAGSEESILKEDGVQVATQPRSVSPGRGGIMRTDEVNVSYTNHSQQDLNHFPATRNF